MAVPSRWLSLPLLAVLAGAAAGAPDAWAAEDAHADVCLEVVTAGLPEGSFGHIVEQVAAVVAERAALFPDPTLEAVAGLSEAPESSPSSPARVGIHSGHAGGSTAAATAPCLVPHLGWTARFARAFLEASADQMLAAAPTTPGIDSDVALEWHPDEARVRTLLTFAGPFDIPNGRCWVDDVLSIDPSEGIAVASGERGLETSPFAEGACGRFFDHLPLGGAGEQAVTLLPAEIDLGDDMTLRFVATEVFVEQDALFVGGTLELR